MELGTKNLPQVGSCGLRLPPHLTIENTSTAGRAVFTTAPIAAGSPILYTLPYAVGVFDSYRKRLCSYLPCSLYAADYFYASRCSTCDQAFYCSEACRDSDAQKHAFACAALKKLRGWTKDRHVASVLKLVILVLAQHQWETLLNYDLKASLVHRDNEDDMLRASYYMGLNYSLGGNKTGAWNSLGTSFSHLSPSELPNLAHDCISRPTFSDVMELRSHVSSWPCEDAKDWERHAPFAMSLFERSPDLLPNQWGFRDILHLASRIESNGFGCFSDDVQTAEVCETPDGVFISSEKPDWPLKRDKSVCFARALYPIASLFNHSCAPNTHAEALVGLRLRSAVDLDVSRRSAEGEWNGTPMVSAVKPRGAHVPDQVTRPKLVGLGRLLTFFVSPVTPAGNREAGDPSALRAGSQVTISYIGLEQPRSTRRYVLLSDYYFECMCERCVEEARQGGTARAKGKGKSAKRMQRQNDAGGKRMHRGDGHSK